MAWRDCALLGEHGQARPAYAVWREYFGRPLDPGMNARLNDNRNAVTDNVCRAMWAMLLAVRQHNQQAGQRISLVACPGLGTTTGHVPYAEAARQMSMADRNFLNPPAHIDWELAMGRQQEIRYGGDFDFHVPPETSSVS